MSSTVRPSEPCRARTAVSKPSQTLSSLTPDITDSLTFPSAKRQTAPRSRIAFSVIRRRQRDRSTDWRTLNFWTACEESPRTLMTVGTEPHQGKLISNRGSAFFSLSIEAASISPSGVRCFPLSELLHHFVRYLQVQNLVVRVIQPLPASVSSLSSSSSGTTFFRH